MKRILFLSILIFASILLNAQSKSVLFIGNSYTYSNEGIPTVLKQIASSLGDELETEMSAPGGYTFSSHVNNQTTLSLINSREWDYVVLQEQSQYPAFPPLQVQNEVYPYAENLCNIIKNNSICSQIIFFMTWGHKNGDQSNCQYYAPLCSYEGMQGRLRESYLEMAENNNAWVCPVGMAFAKIREIAPQIELYSSDNSHPSVYGTYLAACTFYSSIFHKSPVGASYVSNGINSEDALILQNTAWNIFADSLDTWRIDTTTVRADFNLVTLLSDEEGNYFINLSENADSCFWDFGDGEQLWQYDMDLNYIIHQYINNGNYDICLTAYKNCSFDKICKNLYISINYSRTDDLINNENISIFPNPSKDGIISINNSKSKNCVITDLTGKIIANKEIINNKINLSEFANGTYLIVIDSQSFKINLR